MVRHHRYGGQPVKDWTQISEAKRLEKSSQSPASVSPNFFIERVKVRVLKTRLMRKPCH